MRNIFSTLVLSACSLLIAPVASAVVLNINASGILTGAQGVEIFGNHYDVVFRDGTFGELFGNPPDFDCNANGTASCKATANWDALTYAPSGDNPGSDAFANALMDQVFLDGPQGQFDSDPGLIFGCEGTTTHACIVATPTEKNTFAQTGLGTVIFNGRAVNYDDSGVATDGTDRQNFNTNMNLSTLSGAVWADWSPAVVPVPATVWLFGSALGLLGWMRRNAS